MLKIKEKGCTEFAFNLAELGIDSKTYINNIYFVARLTEAETEVKANATSSAEISFSNLDIELIEPSYFKPGFPINFKVTELNRLEYFSSRVFRNFIPFFNFHCLAIHQIS